MALSSLRLRRALVLSASFVKCRPFSAAAPPSSPLLPPLTRFSKLRGPSLPIRPGILGLRRHCATQLLSFHASAPSSDRRSGDADDRKIDPDEILFEGCDYNHWLITMDFPKDPKPTPEEMVETYVQTLAKVVGSVEEAKKRMYACSTTTYTGFQAVMTEEMSEKFRGLPGVIFILPDSYIDPINKQYGGDKYDNGVITPRPPPVQYGRQGRYNDRNRNYNRPRYDRQGPPQGEGRNFAPQQSYGQDRQGYGPPGSGRDYGQASGRENFPGGRDEYQGDRRDSTPAYQGGFNPGQGRSFPSQEHRDFSQGQHGNFPPQEPRNFPQGQQGYGGPDYRQGVNPNYSGPYPQGGSAYGQNYPGASGQNYGWNYSGPTQGQPVHTDHQAGIQGEQSNFYSPQTRTNQG